MWTVSVRNHWKQVIFSDETKIEIGNNRKVYAWCKVDERLRPECNGLYQGRNYKTKFSVMFKGCISYYGVGTLTPVVGNLNSEKYTNILDDNLWPVIAQHFPTSPYIFQEDNISYLRVDLWALRLYHPDALLYSLRRSRRLYSGAEGWYNLNAHG